MSSHIRVRFAPSPTGHLHVGNARAAIFNYLLARANGGSNLLRIEDTDTARSKDEYTESIMATLDWLGIDFDEKPVFQSGNLEKHKKIVETFLEEGKAYKCYCSVEELESLREKSQEAAFKYPGTCRNLENKSGVGFVVRFKLENLPAYLEFEDLIKGKISIESSVLDDFVIIKSDGIPTYNFAVVADDVEMEITHVVRGEDHIINTFRQNLIYQALGKIAPSFAHTSMILGPNGERLSKRHGATSVVDFKEQGILPQALLNYLVRLGWSHGDEEVFSKEQLCKIFTLEAVGTKNAIFDIAKLNWLNSVYLKELDFESFVARLSEINKANLDNFKDTDKTRRLFDLYKPRATDLLDLLSQIKETENFAANLNTKDVASLSIEAQSCVQAFLETAVKLNITTAAQLQELGTGLVKERNIKFPELAKPLRFLLCGKEQGASAFALAEIFGKEYFIKILNLLN